ncbi:MAG: hypothetical protein IJ762_11545 [Bacteroidaceae bacterium]|nr:hypothetical protein [Bacteroidaceae bacterium]
MKKQVLFLLVAFFLHTGNAFGYYRFGKLTVSATGNGKVYAREGNSTAPSAADYKESFTFAATGDQGEEKTRTYYLWAKANDNYDYDIVWSTSGGNTKLASDNKTATQTTQYSRTELLTPTAQTITATFNAYYYFNKVNVKAAGVEGGTVHISKSTATPAANAYSTSMSIAQEGPTKATSAPENQTIYLRARVNDVDYEREVTPTITWSSDNANITPSATTSNSGNRISGTWKAAQGNRTAPTTEMNVTATFAHTSLNSHQVEEGIYYLYNPTVKKFASKGNYYGVSLVADDYGIPVRIIVTSDGYNKIEFLDYDNGTDPHVYWRETGWVYTDQDTDDNQRRWEFYKNTDGTYRIRNKYWSDNGESGQYLYVFTDESNTENLYRVAANSAATDHYTVSEGETHWQLVTQAERDNIIATNLEAQNIATAAQNGMTVASTTALETQLADSVPLDATPSDISFAQSSGTLNWTFNKKGDGWQHEHIGSSTNGDGTNLYRACGTYTRTITGLEKGLYKLTVKGLFRENGHDHVKTLHSKGLSHQGTAYILANGKRVQVKPWYEEANTSTNYPDNTTDASSAFGESKYTNTLYTYVGDDGILSLEIGNENFVWDSWLFLGDVKLTRYISKDNDVAKATRLKSVNVGSNPFQIPTSYANALTTALSSISSAFPSGTDNDKRTAYNELLSASTDFENAQVNVPDEGQKFTITNAEGKALTVKGLKGAASTLGYTEAPGSIYPQALTFESNGTRNGFLLSYTNCEGVKTNLCAAVVDPFTGSDGIWYLRNTATNDPISFYTGDQNYELTLAEAEKASVDFTVKEGYHFSTLMLPFDAGIPAGVSAYTVDGIQQGSIVLTEVSAFEANVPYILWVEDEAELSETVEGWGAAYTDATITSSFLTGTCTTDRTVTVPAGKYVLSAKTYTTGTKVGFYRVQEGKEPTLPRNRAYFDASSASASSAPVKEAYFFGTDDDETGLSDMLTGDSEVEGIYDVKGVRLPRMQRGVNIIRMTDGTSRRVMVK